MTKAEVMAEIAQMEDDPYRKGHYVKKSDGMTEIYKLKKEGRKYNLILVHTIYFDMS